jgi:hypothetical protein
LTSADEIHECRTTKTNTKMTGSKKKAAIWQDNARTPTHLEDTPRRAAMDLQRLIQRPVERSVMAAQLLPQLLLLLGVGEEGGGRVDAPLPLPRVRCLTARIRGRREMKRPRCRASSPRPPCDRPTV